MKVPQNVSESTKRRNPHLYSAVGPLQGAVREPTLANALGTETQRETQGKVSPTVRHRQKNVRLSFRVTLCVYQRILQDTDRCIGGLTDLRDEVAAVLLPDVSQRMQDSDKLIHWEYAAIQTRGEEGVAVRIEKL